MHNYNGFAAGKQREQGILQQELQTQSWPTGGERTWGLVAFCLAQGREGELEGAGGDQQQRQACGVTEGKATPV
jgi:hypothetical protein